MLQCHLWNILNILHNMGLQEVHHDDIFIINFTKTPKIHLHLGNINASQIFFIEFKFFCSNLALKNHGYLRKKFFQLKVFTHVDSKFHFKKGKNEVGEFQGFKSDTIYYFLDEHLLMKKNVTTWRGSIQKAFTFMQQLVKPSLFVRHIFLISQHLHMIIPLLCGFLFCWLFEVLTYTTF